MVDIVIFLAFFQDFFTGGEGKIYCFSNFFCYAIVFGPNLREWQKSPGVGGKLSQPALREGGGILNEAGGVVFVRGRNRREFLCEKVQSGRCLSRFWKRSCDNKHPFCLALTKCGEGSSPLKIT